MDGYTLNAARTIREYESSIQRPKAERTINDSILSALLRGDELPERHAITARRSGTPTQHTVCIQESRIRQSALHLYAKTSQECNRPKRG